MDKIDIGPIECEGKSCGKSFLLSLAPLTLIIHIPDMPEPCILVFCGLPCLQEWLEWLNRFLTGEAESFHLKGSGALIRKTGYYFGSYATPGGCASGEKHTGIGLAQ